MNLMDAGPPKISLVIPSIPGHVQYLAELLIAYAKGDEKPDEVVISLSNAHQVWKWQKNNIEKLGNELFNSFKLIRHRRTLLHGPNRQAAVEHCSHDIVSFFDSDDLPYPDRISMLRRAFAELDVVHVNHGWTRLGKPLAMNETTDVPVLADTSTLFKAYFANGEIEECTKASKTYGSVAKVNRSKRSFAGTTAGHVTVRRSVFEKVRWKDWNELRLGSGEDYEFNIECLFHFRKSAIIDLPLSQYRVGHKPANRVSRWFRQGYRRFVGACDTITG